jgi:hypothetical protein
MENKCKARVGSYQSLVAAVSVVALSAGCTTQGESITFGLGLGAATGAGMGTLVQPGDLKTAATASAIGAAIGAGLGYLAHRDKVKKSAASFPTLPEPKPPKLAAPKYRSIWVPSKIDGDQYIEGHRVYIIENHGKWVAE